MTKFLVKKKTLSFSLAGLLLYTLFCNPMHVQADEASLDSCMPEASSSGHHHHHHRHRHGETGPLGPRGLTGATGATGATGPTGATAGASIIPFATGVLPITLTSVDLDGTSVIGTSGVVGFGSAVDGVSILDGIIDITSLGNFAFSSPRDGTLTSFSAYFSTSSIGLDLPTTSLTVTAQLYESTTPNNLFTAVPGAIVTLSPAITGVITAPGFVTSGIISGLSVSILAQAQYLVVFSVTSTGESLAEIVTGYASAGLAIE